MRGINNMILIMHNQYTSFLASAGLSKDLFALIVKGSSAVVERPRGSVKTTIMQSEIRLD